MALITEEDLVDLFSDLINSAIETQGVKINPVSEAYLVRVVCELSSLPHSSLSRPVFLPDLLRQGLNSQGSMRQEYLRITGDICLLVTGIFPESLEDRHVWYSLTDVMGMGQKAYGHMGILVFDELSSKFPELVEVLNVVGEKVNLISTDLRKYLIRRKSLDSYLLKI